MFEANPKLARRVAVGSLVLDTLLQALALLGDAETSRSSPSAIYVAYAPHPYAPIGLFSAGLIFQIQWLLRLYPPSKDFDEDESSAIPSQITPFESHPSHLNQKQSELVIDSDSDVQKIEELNASNETLTKGNGVEVCEEDINTLEPVYFIYLPFYLIGSILQAGWAIMWMTRHYDYCAMFLLLNLVNGAYALFWVLGGSKNHRYPQSNVFTHLVVKVKIAAAVLYLWKTWGAVDILPPPSATEATLTCIFFVSLALASGPDPTMGLLLVMILLGLATGQNHYLEWSLMFGWTCLSVLLFISLDWAFGAKSRKMFMPQLPQFEEGAKVHGVNRHVV